VTTYEKISVDDFDLQVSIRGNGSPLLLLNGLGARISLLDNLRAELDGYQTIAFDLPGIGGSKPAGDLDMAEYAELAAGLLSKLGLAKPVDVFGVSWGGCLAQELAYRHSCRVRRLILASTTSTPFVLATPAVYRAFFDSSRYQSMERHRRVAGILYGGQIRDQPALLDQVHLHLDPENSRGRRSQLRAAIGWTSLHYAWRLQQPTLVLGAEDDPIVRSYNAQLLATLIPDADKHILPREGHLFVLTSAAQTAHRIKRFLQATARTGQVRGRGMPRRSRAADCGETSSGPFHSPD
jgi:pimeloyl-ACP methyl ester carboxylesterase